MSHIAHSGKRWFDAWIHSDLIGFPVTLAVVVIAAISFSLFLVIGKVGGLFVGKLVFVAGLGGLLGLILRLEGRRGETTDGVARAAGNGPDRILVVANEGLESSTLCSELCVRGSSRAAETMIVAPVVASSALRALADDVDDELRSAQRRLDVAVEVLRRAGVPATGRVDIGQPMRCLIDGLREFPATEVVMIEGGEHGWKDAERFAERIRAETTLPVREIPSAAT